MAGNEGSFSSLRGYGAALLQTPARFARRAGAVTTTMEEMSRVRARSGSSMQRKLRWYDLVGLGMGGMVGAGVFVTVGSAAGNKAGPAVILSYAVSGLCALLSAFCYTEFAVEMPVAGGAFSYLRVTFGEFAAFVTGANLLMEYVVSNAAVARGLTSYIATVFSNSSPNAWRITVSGLPKNYQNIDLIAVAVILTITICICYSTKESSMLNMVLTSVHISLIVLVIAIGFAKGRVSNLVHPMNPEKHPGGFLPYGASGVLSGAAMVYLSYIGYDAVSTMAEEVKHPAKDIPIGVSGSVAIVTVLYCLMAAALAMLVPYDAIEVDAPFSSAFKRVEGWEWVSNLVGVGASLGIVTSLMVAMLGQARYLCVIGRSGVAPPWFARIHRRTGTPVNASAVLGICTAAIAVITDLAVLLELVSIGTLFVFYMVANAVVYRRYVAEDKSDRWLTLGFLAAFSALSVGFTLSWQLCPAGRVRTALLGGFGLGAVAALQAFHSAASPARKPEFWGVPLMPWIPATSAFLNVFLLGSMDRASYVRFGAFSALAVAMYLLYSVHASWDAEEEADVELQKGSATAAQHAADKGRDNDEAKV
ncbi:cationic amino acid transporter 7, chloroplastic-like [Nymphaea colorata]|nr:cationic amino acid transporter 7, chloroplastic-like [Nymphaea colorata]